MITMLFVSLKSRHWNKFGSTELTVYTVNMYPPTFPSLNSYCCSGCLVRPDLPVVIGEYWPASRTQPMIVYILGQLPGDSQFRHRMNSYRHMRYLEL